MRRSDRRIYLHRIFANLQLPVTHSSLELVAACLLASPPPRASMPNSRGSRDVAPICIKCSPLPRIPAVGTINQSCYFPIIRRKSNVQGWRELFSNGCATLCRVKYCGLRWPRFSNFGCSNKSPWNHFKGKLKHILFDFSHEIVNGIPFISDCNFLYSVY